MVALKNRKKKDFNNHIHVDFCRKKEKKTIYVPYLWKYINKYLKSFKNKIRCNCELIAQRILDFDE